MRMNQKKEILIRFWSRETKIGTGSSLSMIHQISAQVIEIAASRMKRFCAIGSSAPKMAAIAPWNCPTSVLATLAYLLRG